MPELTSEAIHLHRFDYSETSQIATFYTRRAGKITALAKGARREKNDFDGPIDLLVVSNISWIPRPPENLSILTGCDELETFRALRQQQNRLYGGFWILFLLRKLVPHEDPDEILYEGAVRTLRKLAAVERTDRVLMEFDLFMLKRLGKFPSFRTCNSCQRPLSDLGRIYFSFLDGGVICKECRTKKKKEREKEGYSTSTTDYYRYLSPSPGALKTLYALSGEHELSSRNIRFSDDQVKEIRNILNHCFRHQLGYSPVIMEYLSL